LHITHPFILFLDKDIKTILYGPPALPQPLLKMKLHSLQQYNENLLQFEKEIDPHHIGQPVWYTQPPKNRMDKEGMEQYYRSMISGFFSHHSIKIKRNTVFATETIARCLSENASSSTRTTAESFLCEYNSDSDTEEVGNIATDAPVALPPPPKSQYVSNEESLIIERKFLEYKDSIEKIEIDSDVNEDSSNNEPDYHDDISENFNQTTNTSRNDRDDKCNTTKLKHCYVSLTRIDMETKAAACISKPKKHKLNEVQDPVYAKKKTLKFVLWFICA
jgi:hypothetical protein